MAGANRPNDRRGEEKRDECSPVHIHIHYPEGERGRKGEEPCINITVNVSQGNSNPDFTTCFGDTYYIMDDTHDPFGGGNNEDPPPCTTDGEDDKE